MAEITSSPHPEIFECNERCGRSRKARCDRQQVAKLRFLGRPPLVPLYLPFSPCPLFFLKGSDCRLNPRRLIFLRRRKPPFSLLLIWPQRQTFRCFAHKFRVLCGLLAWYRHGIIRWGPKSRRSDVKGGNTCISPAEQGRLCVIWITFSHKCDRLSNRLGQSIKACDN